MRRNQHNYADWRERWPKMVVYRQTAAAIDALQRYYARDDSGKPRYTGDRFETMAALNDDPNTLGPADFVAVSMLSCQWSSETAQRRPRELPGGGQ
jgi:hypothetical protein